MLNNTPMLLTSPTTMVSRPFRHPSRPAASSSRLQTCRDKRLIRAHTNLVSGTVTIDLSLWQRRMICLTTRVLIRALPLHMRIRMNVGCRHLERVCHPLYRQPSTQMTLDRILIINARLSLRGRASPTHIHILPCAQIWDPSRPHCLLSPSRC